jgi:hypothetical protein
MRVTFYLLLLLQFPSWPSKANEVELPTYAQTRMTGKGLYSQRSEIGDEIEIELLEPVNLYSRRIFIPSTSILVGKIQTIKEAQRGLRKGKVKVTFNRIIFPNGYVLATEAYLTNQRLMMDNESGNVIGQSDFRDKLTRLGKVSAGALFGGPLGAAAATGILIFDRGGKVRIAPGDLINVYILDVMNIQQTKRVESQIREN